MAHIFSEDNNKSARYVVFFDLDRTLSGEISGNAIVRSAWKKGLIDWTGLLRGYYLYLLYKLRMRDPLDIIDDMVGWVKGRSEAEMEELCQNVFREVLFPSIFREAVTEIKSHQENNAKVMILSTALVPICRAMSVSLGMDGYICSSLEVEKGILTGRPAGRICYGEEKLNRLTGHCAENNIKKSDLWFYSDSISDLSVLCNVGNPVCVNPDRELEREARKRGWKILHWK
jgi:HAD superfamily hydrolase (TIGR01490 family)